MTKHRKVEEDISDRNIKHTEYITKQIQMEISWACQTEHIKELSIQHQSYKKHRSVTDLDVR
jgi:hypothetical protein